MTASVGQKGRRYTAECNDAGDAAAKAVSYGMQLKESGKSYVILGSQHILDMPPADLRAWQAQMGYTFAQAAQALGVSQSAYADWLAGVSRTTGKPKAIDKRTGLACAALAAGLGEWTHKSCA